MSRRLTAAAKGRSYIWSLESPKTSAATVAMHKAIRVSGFKMCATGVMFLKKRRMHHLPYSVPDSDCASWSPGIPSPYPQIIDRLPGSVVDFLGPHPGSPRDMNAFLNLFALCKSPRATCVQFLLSSPRRANGRACFLTAAALTVLMLDAGAVRSAQLTGATIEGIVTDRTEAVIPDAAVEVTHRGTGIVRTILANDRGFYAIPNLAAGNYTMTVTATGFQKSVVRNIDLTPGMQREINWSLVVGSPGETVLVSSSPSGAELASSSIGDVINPKTIVDLPLNGRDWTLLTALEPGVAIMRTQPVVGISNQRPNRGNGTRLTVGGS